MIHIYDPGPLAWSFSDHRDPPVQPRHDAPMPAHLRPGGGLSADIARAERNRVRAELLNDLFTDGDFRLFEKYLREWMAEDMGVLHALPTKARARAEVLLYRAKP